MTMMMMMMMMIMLMMMMETKMSIMSGYLSILLTIESDKETS